MIVNIFKRPLVQSVLLNPRFSIRLNHQDTRTQETQSSPKPKPKKNIQVKETSSFVHNIFRGILDQTQVCPYPQVLDEEQIDLLKLLLDQAERSITAINDPLKNDALELVPEETIAALKAAGGYGLQVPEEYGGAGLNSTQYGRLTEVLGAHDLGLGVFLTGHQGIGFKGILIAGTEEQKERYLPRLASGELMAAFALTEPASGSDASSISTRARLSEDGRCWLLSGSKIWITGGGLADVFTVFAKTEVRDEASGEVRDKITAFIVERDFGGLTNGPPEKKMGIKCSNTAEVYFDNCPVPVENVLGGVGNGFKVAMQILNNGRFGMGTSLAGTMRSVLATAARHVTARTQFGAKLETFGAVQEKVAMMSAYHYATESMAYLVSGTMDAGHEEYQLEAAVSKVFSSEAAWFVTDEAIQILGGMGYMRDSGLEKIMRDLRIFRIFEGTNDILRLFIALTGMQYAGSHLKQLQGAAKDPFNNLGVLAAEAGKRTRSRLGVATSRLAVHGNLAEAAEVLGRDVTLFGRSVESLLVRHQKQILHRQFELTRVADAAILLYVSVAVLARCSGSLEAGLASSRQEEQLARLWCRLAHKRVQTSLATLADPAQLEDFQNMAQISRAVCDRSGVVQPNPLGF